MTRIVQGVLAVKGIQRKFVFQVSGKHWDTYALRLLHDLRCFEAA